MQFQRLLKASEIFTIVLLLIGIFWLAFGSYLFNKNQKINEQTEFDGITAGFILAISFGIFMIIWSILGFVASCKKINWMIKLYYIGIFFVLLASISLFAISVAVSSILPDYKNDKNCTQHTFLKDLKELNDQGFKVLCSTQCKCQYDGSISDAHKQGITNFSSNFGEIRLQNCDFYKKDAIFNDLRSLSGLLKSFEETFECSGFCSENNYYVFSDINEGKPNKDCKVEFLNFLSSNISKFLIASAILTFVLLINFILICIIFHKKPQGQDFYDVYDVKYHNNKSQK